MIARMIDANANRAREAVRVMEDCARFALNDAMLTGALKSLRHDLRSVLSSLPDGWIESNRDTPGDVGTRLSTEGERTRSSLVDVATAAGKRVSEALRAIEEACKTFDAPLAQRVESLRYRAYELERQLLLRMGSGRAAQWRLCLLLTRSLCARPWRNVLHDAIAGGVDCVQVREKNVADLDLLAHVREVLAIARAASIPVIVNDRVDIALACGADGVHLGQDDLGVHDVRKLAGRTLLVGVSTHDLAEAQQAIDDGADYCGVGAMFASATKQRGAAGTAYLRQFVERFPGVPHLAIGGITPANVGQVIAAGGRGVAVSSALCSAGDVEGAARSMTNALRNADLQQATA